MRFLLLLAVVRPILSKEGDLKTKEEMEGLDVSGNVQDLLSFIIGKEKVCLDTLDFVGLSTDCSDLEPFLKKYQQIKKIMVDLLPYTNKIHEYDCSQLLREPERLKAFDCRSQPYKRSK
ncbi:unnamed protein product [Rhizopus microsporus]